MNLPTYTKTQQPTTQAMNYAYCLSIPILNHSVCVLNKRKTTNALSKHLQITLQLHNKTN